MTISIADENLGLQNAPRALFTLSGHDGVVAHDSPEASGTANPLQDTERRITSTAAIIPDFSARNGVESNIVRRESEARFRSAFESAPLGMFLSEDLDVPSKEGRSISRAMLGGVIIYNGALVVLDSSGWAKPGVTATGLIAAGVADQQVDNTDGGDGDLSVVVKRGVFRLLNSADADLITQAEIGDACYIVDDETVANTSGENTRSIAGEIVDVDDDGVWVDIPSAKISTRTVSRSSRTAS